MTTTNERETFAKEVKEEQMKLDTMTTDTIEGMTTRVVTSLCKILWQETPTESDADRVMREAHKIVEDALRSASSLVSDGWIRVEDEVPTSMRTVYVALTSGSVEPAWYSRYEGHKDCPWREVNSSAPIDGLVTHWQPFPLHPSVSSDTAKGDN